MASSSHHHHHKPSTATATAITTTTTSDQQPPILPSPADEYLSNSTHLTYSELLNRRSHRLRQLSKCYREYYWGLMEELKIQHRDYVWKYGISPFREDDDEDDGGGGGHNSNKLGVKEEEMVEDNSATAAGAGGGKGHCSFYGCKLKAMPLTSFCHLHILSDKNQKLYKPCDHIIKSAMAGPITCGKPILRATVPSLCNVHFQKAQKHLHRALKKVGLNISSSVKVAPKLHVLVAEYVREIQAKRKYAMRATGNKVLPKIEPKLECEYESPDCGMDLGK